MWEEKVITFTAWIRHWFFPLWFFLLDYDAKKENQSSKRSNRHVPIWCNWLALSSSGDYWGLLHVHNRQRWESGQGEKTECLWPLQYYYPPGKVNLSTGASASECSLPSSGSLCSQDIAWGPLKADLAQAAWFRILAVVEPTCWAFCSLKNQF